MSRHTRNTFLDFRQRQPFYLLQLSQRLDRWCRLCQRHWHRQGPRPWRSSCLQDGGARSARTARLGEHEPTRLSQFHQISLTFSDFRHFTLFSVSLELASRKMISLNVSCLPGSSTCTLRIHDADLGGRVELSTRDRPSAPTARANT